MKEMRDLTGGVQGVEGIKVNMKSKMICFSYMMSHSDYKSKTVVVICVCCVNDF